MKKLLILLMAFGMIATSCNNKKSSDDRSTTKEKDDYRKDKEDDSKDKEKENDEENSGSWSSSDVSQWMKVCADPLKESMGEDRASAYCTCVMEKISKKYSSFQKANTMGTEEEGMTLGKECIKELGYQ